MKTGYTLLAVMAAMLAICTFTGNVSAQQYKVQQVTSMMGMKMETTVYVKGMRKRTEGGGYAGMPNNLVTIEQCDRQRTITLNTKKKLYYIEPFSKEAGEVINEEEKPSKSKPDATPAKTVSQKGGTVTMWYTITDTGERKKMYGFTARHVWTTMKMKPSADACIKDSMTMKTDGWYVDLPQFNCPVRHAPTQTTMAVGGLDCKDRYVTRQSGKGKLGFPLVEKRTMIMGNRASETSQMETTLETIDFSNAKLDSMLFEIPAGYALAKNIEELQDKPDYAGIKEMLENSSEEVKGRRVNPDDPKKAGVVRIGVFEPAGAEQLTTSQLQTHLINSLNRGKIEAVAVTSAEEAKRYRCDWVLNSKFIQVKPASKIGGLLKAVKNADPFAASSYTIEAQLSLSNPSDGSTHSTKKVSGKFEGTAETAARKALEEGSKDLLSELD